MKTLSALVERESFDVPAFALDLFQRKVRDNLHLEFFLARGRLILTPHLAPLTTREASPAEGERVRALLDENHDRLDELKLYLLYNLSLYSALLETNSYNVALNEHRVISRFLAYGPGVCEVKLYTQPPGDPVERYGDRIYLGRDCLPLDSPQRPHLGLGYLRQSVPEQVVKLKGRLERHATAAERAALGSECLADLDELAEDFVARAERVLHRYPADISSRALDTETLLEANREFREMRHVLSEAESVAREMEEPLLASGSDAARYVTKLRKDLTNVVNYIMLKVNGRISDAVNGIHA
ncbi:MAG TPA: hypothetical protein VGB87_10235 [Vicinamibacteria bacterium]